MTVGITLRKVYSRLLLIPPPVGVRRAHRPRAAGRVPIPRARLHRPFFPRVEKYGVRTGGPNAQPTLLRNRRPSLEPLGAPDTTRRQAAAGLSCTWSDPPSPQLLSLASAPPLLYVCK